MRTQRAVAKLVLVSGLVTGGFAALVSCGARTPLLVIEDHTPDAAPLVDSHVDPPPRDSTVPFDTAPPPFDSSFDASADVPTIDVAPLPDVFVQDCPDAGATLIYVVGESNTLYSFYPPTAQFTQLGVLDCPTLMPGIEPFSMAVDKEGTAYVVFSDGELFQVSTATAACVPTSYAMGQDGVTTFGMGFVGSPTGTGDTLFVAPDPMNTLATIDTTSFVLSIVAPFSSPNVIEAELSGTGDGRLFAFYSATDPNSGTSSAVAQIDPTTADLLANNVLSALPQGSGWAFAFWGGSFYLFTAPTGSGGSIVTQFNPADLSQNTVASIADIIVGAGVSTCAPMR